MSTHNISFHGETRKILCGSPVILSKAFIFRSYFLFLVMFNRPVMEVCYE